MKREGAQRARGLSRAVLALLSATLLASCSSTSDPIARLGLSPQSLAATEIASADDDPVVSGEAQSGYAVAGEEDPALPEQIAATATPQQGEVVEATPVATAAPAEQRTEEVAAAPSQAEIDTVVQTRMGPSGAVLENVPAATPGSPAPAQPKKRGFFASLFGTAEPNGQVPSAAAETQPETVMAAAPAPDQSPPTQEEPAAASAEAAQPEAQPAQPEEPGSEVASAATFIENRPPEAAQGNIAGPKKRGFLSSFFSTAEASPAPRPLIASPGKQTAPQPVLSLASAEPTPRKIDRSMFDGDPLPGVRQGELFEIKRKSGIDDDSDIDLHEGGGEFEVASAAGLARLAPNGLLKQTDRVDVACLKPSLIRVLKTIEGHYGRKVVITSGYRSPPVNRAARGARNSLHMYCAAADVQVEGVTKWELAQFVRSMPGRGGVGTYCHTNSVHVDVGPERDWNWRCRKRRK